jgi:hypothetical protein
MGNLYLDSTIDDFDDSSGHPSPIRKTYCVPTHKSPQQTLICLIIQFVRTDDLDVYRRVGLGLIYPDYDGDVQDAIWDGVFTAEQRIRLI